LILRELELSFENDVMIVFLLIMMKTHEKHN
jgi:hypothetical protein